ncbi:MAG: tRNA lysidine(34) synthetase TilS [Bacteroidales bacterium]
MLEDFKKYLKENCGCSLNNRFLLTVSGGIDSVVMTHLFIQAGIDFGIAHCNFGLREEESEADQAFVEELARKTGKPFYLIRFNTPGYAAEHGLSIQMAARELRYNWFHEIAEKNDFEFIAIAHNQNDVVETVLINFARGTGIRGLTGIHPRVEHIVRPLLFASRRDIEHFAEAGKLAWREDSSNSQTKYIRNRIRHEIIPELVIINPSFLPNAIDTIDRLGQTELLLDYLINCIKKEVYAESRGKVLINMEKLKKYPATETLLFELLRPFGCNQRNIRSIVDSFGSIPGKQIITRTHTITRDRLHLIITGNTLPDQAELLIEADTASINSPVNLVFKNLLNQDFKIPTAPNYAVLDAEQVEFPLTLRRWKPGDSFQPLGMKGKKKVSDYLVNNKVPLPDKQHVWVLESKGRIIWLVNHRIDDRFKISSSTRNILLLEFIDSEPEP